MADGVTSPVTTPERPRCPYCGEDVLIEVDAARAICFVCARTWVPEPPS